MASFDLGDVEVFTAGAVGQPGRRIFYLQVRNATTVLSFKLEKQQVDALGRHFAAMLSDLPAPVVVPGGASTALVEPVEPEWVVGALGAAYEVSTDRVHVLLEELVVEELEGLAATEAQDDDEDDEDDDDEDDRDDDALAGLLAFSDDEDADEDDDLDNDLADDERDDLDADVLAMISAMRAEPGRVRLSITRAQAAGFAALASTLMSAGRPPCQFCGRPMDPDGHPCPRMN